MNDENINISELTTALTERPDLPLRFFFEGVSINAGYHVTEVRHSNVSSLDCGKGTDQWQEITIQLLDGSPKSEEGYMSTSKFMGIVGAAKKALIDGAVPFLFFEFAPKNGPIRKLSVHSIERDEKAVSIFLGSEQAVCKPLHRVKRSKAASTSSSTVALQTQSDSCCPDRNRPVENVCCS